MSQSNNGINTNVVFGFWIYLMSDCLIFGTLFAVYAVMRHATFGGPDAGELATLPFVFTETMLLLVSSFTCGLAMLYRAQNRARPVLFWLGVTFILGAAFIGMELTEFAHLVHEGNSWQRSGFLSAFFTLVGTHGLHVLCGLIWLLVMMVQVGKRGLSGGTSTRLVCFALFWHFLDVVWIFVFSIVYLMGAN